MLSLKSISLMSKVCRAAASVPVRSMCLSEGDTYDKDKDDMRYKNVERGINRVMLMGRVGKLPIKRGRDQPLVSFPLATGQTYTDADGNLKYFTEWHNITVFSPRLCKLAENMSVGDRIFIEGSIHTRRYRHDSDDPDSSFRYFVNVKANNILNVQRKRVADSMDHENRVYEEREYDDKEYEDEMK